MNIIVSGTISYDYIMDFPGIFADRIMPDKIHSLSLSFLVDKLHKQFGGTAGNIAYNLRLLGLEPVIMSVAGNDFDPGFFVEHFVKDMGIALHEANRMGLAMPGLALARQLYEAVIAQGHARAGTHALQLALSAMSGIDWRQRSATG